MTVRRDLFDGCDAEGMYEVSDFNQTMLDKGYSEEDAFDTCIDLLSIYQYAAYKGGYEVEPEPDYDNQFDTMEYDTFLRSLANSVADCYVFGYEPNAHYALQSLLTPEDIAAEIDLNEFLDCAVEGGLIEMLDAWLVGVPAEYIVDADFYIKSPTNWRWLRYIREIKRLSRQIYAK